VNDRISLKRLANSGSTDAGGALLIRRRNASAIRLKSEYGRTGTSIVYASEREASLATTRENIHTWNDRYDWSSGGSEWSEWWGGVAAQWEHTLEPRIGGFVPAATILEIGPGRGRWSRYLRPLCSRLLLADLSERCIDACAALFPGDATVDCFVNDGSSFPMIAADSVDFIFSFDSLVHAESDVMQAYAREFARILTADGVAFIHHSNIGAYGRAPFMAAKVPVIGPLMRRLGVSEPSNHWRAGSVDAERVRGWISGAGLHCASQELINWGTRRLIDCISVITRPGSRHARPTKIVRNAGFMAEAQSARIVSELYPSGGQ